MRSAQEKHLQDWVLDKNNKILHIVPAPPDDKELDRQVAIMDGIGITAGIVSVCFLLMLIIAQVGKWLGC